jgi:hypothetical protein
MRMFLGALLILCLVQSPYARAQSQGSPDKSLAARTEYIPIETLTLSDQQFLTGDKGGAKPATVAGAIATGARVGTFAPGNIGSWVGWRGNQQ